MATEKWSTPSDWADAFSAATLNSIASGNSIASDIVINNSSNLDIFADISIALASAAFVAPNFIGVYLFPRNKDGTTYGDGAWGSSTAGMPPGNYAVGSIGLVAATQAQVGTLRGIILPPGYGKFVFYNGGGVALAGAGGNTAQFRTYNRVIA